jgi:hypothetical protein
MPLLLVEFKARLRKSNSKRYTVATLTPLHCTACTWGLTLESITAPHAQEFMLDSESSHDTSTPIPSEKCELQSFVVLNSLCLSHSPR